MFMCNYYKRKHYFSYFDTVFYYFFGTFAFDINISELQDRTPKRIWRYIE